MPIHLTSVSRRGFLQVAGAAVAFHATRGTAKNNTKIQEDLVYILNDTHIGEKHPADSPVPSNLRQVVTEICDRSVRPASVIINGDLALKDGQPGDYEHFAKLIQPLRDAAVDTHLTLGNHDNREVFYNVMKSEQQTDSLVESRHVSVVETKRANFYLLDSLQKTMVTQGTVGAEQLHWLAEALNTRTEKPAIIVAHHNPRLGGDPAHFPGGLIDSAELWQMLEKQTHVKAYIHGHIHDRTLAKHRGIHILNTPATSYVADPKKSTTGWTTIRLKDSGCVLTTHTTDKAHPWNGESTSIDWRRS